MLARLNVGRKLLVVLSGIFAIGLIGTAVVIGSILSVSNSGLGIGERLYPLGNAAFEIKQNATAAHLRLEEIMGGDGAESIDTVYGLLDRTRDYAAAILDGATLEGVRVEPSESDAVRDKIAELLEELRQFRSSAADRYALLAGAQGAGSGADAEFDALYDDLSAALDRIGSENRADAGVQALTGQARFLLAHGHLMVEEVLGGDAGEDPGEALAAFATAAGLLDAAGGALAPEASAMAGKVRRFSELAETRIAAATIQAQKLEAAEIAFDAIFTRYTALADEAAGLIGEEIAAGMGSVRQVRGIALGVSLATSVALVAAILASYRLLNTLIGARLTVLAGLMTDLLGGKLEVETPAWQTADEVGVLRDSVSQLRTALLRQRELEAVAARDRDMAEEQRQAAEAQHRLAEDARQAAEAEREATGRRAAAAEAFAREFGRVVDRASQGHFDARMDSAQVGTDYAKLAGGLNGMMDTVERGAAETARVIRSVLDGDLSKRMEGVFQGQFHSLQTDVNETMTRLEALVEEILATADIIAAETEAISANAGDLSSRAERQAATVEQTSAAMTEMSANVTSNASNAETAGTTARTAANSAEQGGAIVNRAIEAMGRIEASSNEIRKIVEVIDSISFQTNLLALNAGVEAARAGDAGKGFAVVASEVRGLALRASEAARDINALIEKSNLQVAEGSRLVNDSGQALQQIVSSVADILSRSGDIAVASTELAAGVTEVTQAVATIDSTTQHTAALAGESAAAATQLAGRAAKLREIVGFFRRADAVADHAPSPQRPLALKNPAPAPKKPAPAPAAGPARGWTGKAAVGHDVPVIDDDGWADF